MKPIKTASGKVTVPEEVITSMANNKIGLKGMWSHDQPCSQVIVM